MTAIQPGILAALPTQARYASFVLLPGVDADAVRQALQRLQDWARGRDLVVGIGRALFACLGRAVPDGLDDGPVIAGSQVALPVQPLALWCWLRGDDRGQLLHDSHQLAAQLAPALRLQQGIDAFLYRDGHDLTGFEDGTENPVGDAAVDAAADDDGASFVLVQQWLHDFAAFNRLAPAAQDDVIGRHRIGNEEFDSAPPSAHVKRTAQESFSPEAFVLRRSMPWTADQQAGLVFVAFARSPRPFAQLLTRMTGAEDGIVDGLFSISAPLASSYLWCPPMAADGPDLTCLGI